MAEAERRAAPDQGLEDRSRQSGERGRGRLPNPRRRQILIAGAAILAVILVAGGVYYWLGTRDFEWTDDAFIDGNTAQVAPKVAGRAFRVHFADNQEVSQGELLVELDPRDFEAQLASANATLGTTIAQVRSALADLELTRVSAYAALDQAQAALNLAQQNVDQAHAQADAAKAEADRADADVPRYSALFRRNDVPQRDLEQVIATARNADAQYQAARKAVASAEAQVREAEAQLASAKSAPQQVAAKEALVQTYCGQAEQAQAQVRQAALNLSYTNVYAPRAGRVTKRSVQPGDQVLVGQALTQLVFGAPWVTANFKETQLNLMRVGQPATIQVDAYPDQVLNAHVDSIQPGTGSQFSVLPPENATGNYVKIVQRVPVKIALDGPPDPRRLLALGMSVEPSVDVAANPREARTSRAGTPDEAALPDEPRSSAALPPKGTCRNGNTGTSAQ